MSKVFKIFSFTFCMLIVSISLTYFLERPTFKSLKNNTKLTVGITTKISYGGRSSRYIHYSYLVNDIEYLGTKSTQNKKIIVPRGQILVAYDSLNPEINVGIIDVTISPFSLYGADLTNDFHHKIEEITYWNWK